MSEIRLRRIKKIATRIRVPGDKSMSHRAVMLAGLAKGTSRIAGFLAGEDCARTLRAMQALGAEIESEDGTNLEITGTAGDCRQVLETIDCGNSGTSLRLLSGILAGQPFSSRLSGDASLNSRPMDRITKPLTEMGALIKSENGNDCAPLLIQASRLHPIDHQTPVASAQIKSCVLLAGMFAEGTTSVSEPNQSRDHTERMMRHFMLPIRSEGLTTFINGLSIPTARDFSVPGDFSSAAFWIAAAAALPGSRLVVENLGLNPTRTGLITVLLRMGAQIRENLDAGDQIEPRGTVEVRGAPLHGTIIEGALIANVIDEIPIIAALGALADGTTVIREASELRFKETDRLAAIATNLAAFGVPVDETPDGLVIQGGSPLAGATVDSFGDHRIAMAFAVLGLFCEGETRILNTDCIRTSYPGFERQLASLRRRHRRHA
ncbi:MAG TPA: 3-phosphoshikimate 1-carboxyvinyltransferase [Verrucomicrobiae bacterium]|nr:3-phosphoshikimate 1-carboxyvinyltransferase [Verrucomicrobiae bacterium]